MNSAVRLALLLCLESVGLNAQFNFEVANRQVQVHSFASQGFTYSDANNFLTMNTSQGSPAMTDGGANVSVNLTDKLRIGAQVYVSNVGQLGKWKPQLDWAVADYRFKDWLGVRAGKVKTSLGLYNDTQDMSFLHTWAMLPQSLYPLDLRDVTISHIGGDLYGNISFKRGGSVSYTAYAGMSSDTRHSGYYFNTEDNGIPLHRIDRTMIGTDVRWTAPIDGLMVGTSWMRQKLAGDGTVSAAYNLPYRIDFAPPADIVAAYADFSHGRWHFSGEYRRRTEEVQLQSIVPGLSGTADLGDSGIFVSAAFRVNKRLELGTYHSRYFVNQAQAQLPGSDHIRDQVIAARIDVTKYWHIKAEGHFMDGIGDLYSAHGFYLRSNLSGLVPQTNMVVLRTGWNF